MGLIRKIRCRLAMAGLCYPAGEYGMSIQRDSPFFIAHSGNRGGRLEPMKEHLKPVACQAAVFATAFGARDQARAMGLLHDIGKYSERFLRRLTEHTREPAGNHAIAGAGGCVNTCGNSPRASSRDLIYAASWLA